MKNLSCVWNTISTELTVSINETGSYRVVIGYIDGTFERFYSKFNNSCQAELQFESDITIDESAATTNFAVSFSGEVSGGFTVDYNTSGISADNSTDFSGSSGTLNFSGTNGETQYINIPIIDDNLIEPQETFTVELSNVSTTEVSINGGTSTGTIIDNDLQTGMGISFTNSNITVNEDEGFATLTVSLTGNSQESFTVDYTTSNGSAQQPDDFTSTSGQLTFPAFAGSSQDIIVPIVNDGAQEASETFTVTLSNLSTFLIPIINSISEVTIEDSSTQAAFSATTVLISDVTCSGSEDASIQVDVSGGTAPFTYELFDSNDMPIEMGTNPIFENLIPDSYYITVTDSDSNWVQSNLVVVTEPIPMNATVTVNYEVCSGNNNNTTEITVSGGVAGYEYALNGGPFVSNNIFENLSPGDYHVTIRDINSCLTDEVFTIESLSPITAEVSTSMVSCTSDNDGSLSISVTVNSSDLLYSIGGLDYVLDPNFNNLSVGDYEVFVQNSYGCVLSMIASIGKENDCDDFTLPVDNFTIETTSETCASSNNGSVLIKANENLDYEASLIGTTLRQPRSFKTFTSFQDLEAGSYELCITVNGENYEKCFTFQITEPDDLGVSSKTDVTGKTVSLSLSGGSNYYINVNGTEYSTSENEITLPLSKVENNISVKTDKDCQGVYENTILATYDSISIFPNPVKSGDISILLPESNQDKEVLLTVFSQNGIRVLEKLEKTKTKTVKLNVDSLVPGVYTIIITSESQNSMRKIIKK